MEKESSIEWIFKQIKFYIPDNNKFEKLKSIAKDLHKSEIIHAYRCDLYPCSDEDAEQFYKQNYE